MIIIRPVAAPASLPAGTYMALVELEVGYTCCNCDELIPAGARAIYVLSPDKPARFAHPRSACPRPPVRVLSQRG